MKRRLLILGVFLLLGAAVNVAVAWGCVYRSWPSTALSSSVVRRFGIDPPVVRATDEEERRAFARGWGTWQGNECVTHFPRRLVREEFGTSIHSVWDRWQIRCGCKGICEGTALMWRKVNAGWPLNALQFEAWPDHPEKWPDHPENAQLDLLTLLLDEDVHARQSEFVIGAVTIDRTVSTGLGRFPFHQQFPCDPLWVGFSVNTAIYAAMLWLPIRGPFALRRWLRGRGLCPACGYPVGVSPVCTECGKPVRPRSVEPAT